MKRARAAIGTCLWAGTLPLGLAWAASRAITDRFEWSQWLWWIPSPIYLAAIAALIAPALILAPRRAARPLGLAAIGALTAGLAHLLILDWRLPSRHDAHLGPPLRILFWNPSLPRGGGIADRILTAQADIAIIANPPLRDDGLSISDLDTAMGEGASVIATGNAVIATRFPVHRWGGTTLGLRGRVPRIGHTGDGPDHWIDPGHASFVEFDTTGPLGRPIVVWIIDLPSDPALPRAEITRTAAARTAAFDGPTWTRAEGDRFLREDRDPGFPPPDLIIGDFNIPRGSWSLRAITAGLDDAYTRAGRGPMGTWPRANPIHHLDQAFISANWNVARYHALDPGIGLHRMIVLEITPMPSGEF